MTFQETCAALAQQLAATYSAALAVEPGSPELDAVMNPLFDAMAAADALSGHTAGVTVARLLGGEPWAS